MLVNSINDYNSVIGPDSVNVELDLSFACLLCRLGASHTRVEGSRLSSKDVHAVGSLLE